MQEDLEIDEGSEKSERTSVVEESFEDSLEDPPLPEVGCGGDRTLGGL